MTVNWKVPQEGDIEGIITEARLAELDQVNIPTDLDSVKSVTDGVGLMVEGGAAILSEAAEVDVYINNTPMGLFRPAIVKIDFTNQQAGETITIREYYRIEPGGNMILQDTVNYAGVQNPALIPINLDYNRFGVRVTMERIAGVQRSYYCSAMWEE